MESWWVVDGNFLDTLVVLFSCFVSGMGIGGLYMNFFSKRVPG